MKSVYNRLLVSLKELKEEYKILPSKFLKKKIELVEKKIKEVDLSLDRDTSGGGNYEKS